MLNRRCTNKVLFPYTIHTKRTGVHSSPNVTSRSISVLIKIPPLICNWSIDYAQPTCTIPSCQHPDYRHKSFKDIFCSSFSTFCFYQLQLETTCRMYADKVYGMIRHRGFKVGWTILKPACLFWNQKWTLTALKRSISAGVHIIGKHIPPVTISYEIASPLRSVIGLSPPQSKC